MPTYLWDATYASSLIGEQFDAVMEALIGLDRDRGALLSVDRWEGDCPTAEGECVCTFVRLTWQSEADSVRHAMALREQDAIALAQESPAVAELFHAAKPMLCSIAIRDAAYPISCTLPPVLMPRPYPRRRR